MSKGRIFHPQGGDKLTQQHMGDASDINHIMERHRRTGLLAGPGRPSGRKPNFGNISGESFHEMLVRLQTIQGEFSGLPAKIRRRFGNNPENLLHFLGDASNIEEAIELGLVDPDQLSPERKQQLNLVDQAEVKDREEFEEWKRTRRQQPPGNEGDPFEPEGKKRANASDPEAQPRFSKKNRTS